MRQLKKLFICVFALFCCANLFAQHSTSSPYSMLGIGELNNKTFGLTSGMANAGIGLYSPNTLNLSNPAAIAVDSLSFIFDVSMSGKFSQYTGLGVSEQATNVSIRKVSFGVRPIPKLSVSMGIIPYSNVQYNIATNAWVEGENTTYDVYYKGSGGLTKLYLAGSYKLFSNESVANESYSKLYLGVNASYLFGRINRVEMIDLPNSLYIQSVQTSTEVDKILFDFGLMYDKKINASNKISVGLVYGYKTDIKLRNFKDYSMSGEVKTKNSSYTSLPQFAGAGFSVQNIKGSSYRVFSIDYKLMNWGDVKSYDKQTKYSNSHRINAGLEYIPNYRTPRNYFQQVEYQLGGYYEKSNLVINNNNLSEYGLTAGVVLPLKNSSNVVFVAADFGRRGGKRLINENFVNVNIGISLNQEWFFKWFYD